MRSKPLTRQPKAAGDLSPRERGEVGRGCFLV